jgi:TolB-like protein
MDGNSIAFLGELLFYTGDWDRGLALVGRAKQLNPNHPGWYWYADFYNSYRQRDYRGAITFLLKADLPGHWFMHAGLAAAYAQLGENNSAGKALRDLLKLRPDFPVVVRKEAEKWWNPEYVDHFIDGLRKAGLEIARENPTLTDTAGKSSGKTHAQQAFWVAVLPFKSSGEVEMESFADGLSEDVTTGLSRFPYLSVVARAAAARLKGRAGDQRALGAELGARYVVEGSIRKQASTIRVSAHLADTETGAQLWAETYDRDLEASSIFRVQDDIAAQIVATVADSYGVLVNSMTAQSAGKNDADLTPAEWHCQYFAYRQQITPANHAALKKRLETALERDNRRAELWSCLAQMYVDAYAFGFESDPTSLDRALTAARRGVEFGRTNQFGLVSLAQTYFFRQNLAAFRPAAERAMALNPLNTDALGILGLLIVHTGEFERGATIVRHAMELNPDHAGWMHFGPIWEHFHKHEYERALDHANRVDIPGLFWPYLVVAAANGHLGRRAEAEAAVRDLLAIDPEFAAHARGNIASWHFASGLLEPLLDGLRKAGLSLPA